MVFILVFFYWLLFCHLPCPPPTKGEGDILFSVRIPVLSASVAATVAALASALASASA